MLIGFICPDGKKVLVEDCLEKCRMKERCLTLPTLKLMSEEREWNGVASTTQLLNGTMLEFLKLTKDYYVDPDSRAFMLAGTKHHKALDVVAKELGLPSEVALSIDRDIFDLIEVEDEGLVLTDYKLWGSFKVAMALGIVETGKKPDPSGAVYKSTGKWGKAGSPKMIPTFEQDLGKADNWEAELQLNRYRIKIEEFRLEIHRMQLQVTVRDGGLFIAHQRGIFRKTYRIPIKLLDNDIVKEYFTYKAAALEVSLGQDYCPEPCTNAECWDGIRCRSYCDVAEFCPKGRLIKSLEGGKE